MRVRPAIVLFGALLAAGAARAAEGDGEPAANYVSNYIQWQLFHWGIWTTGIARLNNAELYGLAACVVMMGFGVSGVAIILFEERGLGFRSGWMLSLPAIIASMLVYCYYRPYPTMQDAPFMFGFAVIGALVAVTIGGIIKTSMSSGIEKVAKTPRTKQNPALEKRLRMATRSSPNARREF